MEVGLNENYISNQIVWRYQSLSHSSFYSHNGSCANRLPNGNTFVATARGQMFQVTSDGELAWEYIVPMRAEGIRKVIIDMDSRSNNVGFPWMYGPDHPALKGKDLTPKGKITELAIQGKLGQGLSEGIQWPRKSGKGRKGKGGKRGKK
ncbi:MAG: hypothetical protein JRI86_09580 [Deltaproteobacteria bacterium]|nr:hypothetical protein [Deltaproteobacteria bacterium]